MTPAFNLCLSLVGSFFFVLFVFRAIPISAEPSDKTIVSRTAKIDDVELQYLTAGHGATVIFLHGFAETSRMWRPLIRLLAENFTVIAPDLPGIGDSSISADKIDMITSANQIHA